MKDISLHLLDIIRNSTAAGARNIKVQILADINEDELRIIIEDDGIGMDNELLERVTNPFTTTRTTRKIGMGIPLLKASAEMSSGELKIDSVKGKGTVVCATFKISHIDRPPLGDIASTMTGLIAAEPEIEFILNLNSDNGSFKFDTTEIKEKLGGVPINEIEVVYWIREFIEEGIKSIFGGVLDEIDS
ncbi:MAG TPA: ATP-binding protein [Clostridiaceae bacterium]|nr:ATP-binding protein [Clostridiaceae bacterium]